MNRPFIDLPNLYRIKEFKPAQFINRSFGLSPTKHSTPTQVIYIFWIQFIQNLRFYAMFGMMLRVAVNYYVWDEECIFFEYSLFKI